MKQFICILTVFLFASCNSSNNNQTKFADAQSQAMNGIYVFIKSKPTHQYDFLGSIELKWYDKLTQLDEQNLQTAIKSITGIVSFSDNLENTLIQVRQKFPAADAVIFDDDISRCEVIKFK